MQILYELLPAVEFLHLCSAYMVGTVPLTRLTSPLDKVFVAAGFDCSLRRKWHSWKEEEKNTPGCLLLVREAFLWTMTVYMQFHQSLLTGRVGNCNSQRYDLIPRNIASPYSDDQDMDRITSISAFPCPHPPSFSSLGTPIRSPHGISCIDSSVFAAEGSMASFLRAEPLQSREFG